jgi:uncharacterized protein YejL (UPF0352 family)
LVTYNNFAGASFQNVRAKFDFEATSDKQLSMKVGDVVVVLEKHASGWYKGELNGAIGMFPSNYTEVMAEVAPEDDATRTKVAELKAKRMARLQVRNSASPEVAASTIQRLVRSKSQTKRSESLSAGPCELVRVLFKFDALSDSQLSLKVGDIVTVRQKHASGWYSGTCNGSTGLFPSNYTEPWSSVQQTSGSGACNLDIICPILIFFCA